MADPMIIYGVHAVRAKEIRATEALSSTQTAACEHAAVLSTDPGVLAAAVTRLTVDELGTRTNIAMFVGGKRQVVPYVSDCRTIYGGRKHVVGPTVQAGRVARRA